MAVLPSVSIFQKAYSLLKESPLIDHSPCDLSTKLSGLYKANIWLKREELQETRTVKCRAAVYQLSKLTSEEKKKGVVLACSTSDFPKSCCYACAALKIPCLIVFTESAARSKLQQCERYGKEQFSHVIHGKKFTEAEQLAQKLAKEQGMKYINSNSPLTVEAYGSISLEILNTLDQHIDYIFVPVGFGTLLTALQASMAILSPSTEIIGCESQAAPLVFESLQQGKPVTLPETFSRFCDSTAHRSLPQPCFDRLKQAECVVTTVPEGQIASSLVTLYEFGIICEPTGALGVAALDQFRDKIKGKNVVCITTGSNFEIARLDYIREYALTHEQLKVHLLLCLRASKHELRSFIKNCLTDEDEIIQCQYQVRSNRETIGVELTIQVPKKGDFERIAEAMKRERVEYKVLNKHEPTFDLLV